MPGPRGAKATAFSCVQDRGSKSRGRSSDSHILHNSVELNNDGIHNGVTFPTNEEKKSLRRVPGNIPSNGYLICLVVFAERFSYYGTFVLMWDFAQRARFNGSYTAAGSGHSEPSRLLRISSQTYNVWNGLTPFLGAYIADTYWGRFKTASFGLFVALVGHLILIISAVLVTVDKEGAIVAFVVALIITGLGTGLFRATFWPLAAEQYEKTKLFVSTTNGGERVIVDPALTVSRVYMYLYFFTNLGALLGRITISHSVDSKYVGFWFGYMIPTVALLLCPLVTWSGHRYVHSPPTGSVLSTALRLFRLAARGKWNLSPVQTYRNLTAPDFWDNAKPSRQAIRPEWMNFDDQWVDEVKRGFKACGVFCWFPIYWLIYNQPINQLEALRIGTHSIPSDVRENMYLLLLLIFIPLCELVLYPFLRRMHLNFSALKKITSGFMTGAAAMVWEAVMQHYIYKTNPCSDDLSPCDTVSSLFAWIQTGSPILISFAEILVSVTGLEYAFTKAPKNMRSLVMSIFFSTPAFAVALDVALPSISFDLFLARTYSAVGALSLVTSVIFWWTLKDLDAAEDELNNLPAGSLQNWNNFPADPIRLENEPLASGSRAEAVNSSWQPGSLDWVEHVELQEHQRPTSDRQQVLV